MLVQMALLGLLLWVCGGGALLRFGAVETLDLPRTIFQLYVGVKRGRGGGGLQETAVVEEAEDSAALLGKGIQDKTIFYSRERRI